ncbi:MAG: archaeosortase/exosortase family protein [Candidatus Hydrogenedentes bacterium]|nr:archaeosortase/exosortase family protein [Candidatus Hydrogenedentota bacterium]
MLFVLIFLVSTFALLTLNRAAINSSFMNWYLFHVASHTASVLNIIGEHGRVEDPDLYKDRAASVRASIEEWKGVKPKPGDVPESAANEKPLTAYEVWVYRALRLRNDYKRELEQLALTDPLPRPEIRSIDDQLRHVAVLLDRVEQAMRRASRSGPIQVTTPDITATVNAAREELRLLESSDASIPGRQEALDALEKRVEAARVAQRAFIEGRARKTSVQISDRTGPTVDFLMKRGLDSDLADKQKQLDAIQLDVSLTPEQRAERAKPIRAEIEQLNAKRSQAPDEKSNKDIRFRFNVVPDCGALSSMAIFLAAMLAFPTHMWKRLVGLLIGIPILYAVNIVRLSCLAVIGAYTDAGELFTFAHEYVWQGIYILFVVTVWLLWVEFLVKPRKKKIEA